MNSCTSSRLSAVSRVTIHLFLLKVAIAALAAFLTGSFVLTFSLYLFTLALVQLLAALGSPEPAAEGFNEWDGALWLIALGMAIRLG